jgi:hypothetical protein
VRVKDREVERLEPHPFRLARDYLNRLRDECRRHPAASRLLLHQEGSDAGCFVLPFCHFAVLSNITAEQLDGLADVFPPSRVLTRDGLQRWEDLPPEQVLDELRAYFDPYWPFPTLTDEQINALRYVIHPAIGIHRPDPHQLATLDLRQERHAWSVGDGHRVIHGVAGSGKTVLLVAQAKLLSEQRPDGQVLVLCFNVCLAG